MVEFFLENGDKVSIMVWNNRLGGYIVFVYIINIQSGYIFSYSRFII
jgi:hypothetical protein